MVVTKHQVVGVARRARPTLHRREADAPDPPRRMMRKYSAEFSDQTRDITRVFPRLVRSSVG